mmetsp:Transcript_37179/g.55612  ORF Transcript_37179/g.55612 Transcript_37179/m.55612 type:complete len:261 (-) Transcript_37179:2174-2956(-)
MKCFEEATEVRMECLVEDHPDIVVSLAKKGMVQFALDQLEEAQQSFEQALNIRQHVLDSDHLELAKIRNNLGCVMYQRGQLVDALECFTASLNIQRKWLEGPIRRESTVFDTSVTLGNMGKVFFDRNDNKMSQSISEEALLLQTTTFRKDHDIVLTTLRNLACAKVKNGEETKAINLYNSILRSQTAKYGCNSQYAVETKGLMCMIYVELDKFEEAQHCLTGVLQWQRENLEEHHPAVQKADDIMKRLEETIDDDDSVWI